jgi:hypothetical protein
MKLVLFVEVLGNAKFLKSEKSSERESTELDLSTVNLTYHLRTRSFVLINQTRVLSN